MKRFSLKTALIVCALLVSPSPVAAQINRPVETPTAERQAQIKLKIAALKRDRIIQQCDSLRQKIEQISSRVDTLKNKRGNLKTSIIERLNQFIERVEATNLDAGQLRANVQQLEKLIGEADELWTAYDSALDSLSQAKCAQGDEPQAFHEALVAARFAKADIREKTAEIREYFTNDVKASLAAIREQLKPSSNQ